jgi:hypothetical protein
VDHLNALLPRSERARLAMGYFFLFAANAPELKRIKELRILTNNWRRAIAVWSW